MRVFGDQKRMPRIMGSRLCCLAIETRGSVAGGAVVIAVDAYFVGSPSASAPSWLPPMELGARGWRPGGDGVVAEREC